MKINKNITICPPPEREKNIYMRETYIWRMTCVVHRAKDYALTTPLNITLKIYIFLKMCDFN